MTDTREIIQSLSSPLAPIPTQVESCCQPRRSVRAVLWDVYGTMLISGSGDVGTVAAAPGEALAAACGALGIPLSIGPTEAAGLITETIRQHHARTRVRGVSYPEVNIIEVWQDWLTTAVERRWIDVQPREVDVQRLAVEYEGRANPVWPMPHLTETLEKLLKNGLTLGIISNAQFFTSELFPALLGKTLSELGFSQELSFWSFQHLRAKPDTYLFRLAQQALQSRGIQTGETLYIGNDMLNDIMPAQRVGFVTGLFAGDNRSLRLRLGDQRVASVRPDLTLTDLRQVVECLAQAEMS